MSRCDMICGANSPRAMKNLLLSLVAAAAGLGAAEPRAQRISHTDPSHYRHSRSHDSAGDMACQTLVPANTLTTNLNFVHRCQIMPGGGVGAHFHNECEEMFVIFDGAAEFTVDGRTSALQGTVGAPVRMGHSHAIYNPSDKAVEFMNINVSLVKNEYDAFNLGDARTDVTTKDKIPTFMTMRLDKARLRAIPGYHGGDGTARYRRALDPSVFLTNWSYVDHLLLPPGSSEGHNRHPGIEEVYYVLNGQGEVFVGGENSPVQKGDAIPIRFNEVHSLKNSGTGDLEFMILGIAAKKGALETIEVPAQTK
jgi:mannose-6-phosphate isomerase-like protein (cupin superfamily)